MLKLWMIIRKINPFLKLMFSLYHTPKMKMAMECYLVIRSLPCSLLQQTVFPSSVNNWLQTRSNQWEVVTGVWTFGSQEKRRRGNISSHLPALTDISKQWLLALLRLYLPMDKFLPLWSPLWWDSSSSKSLVTLIHHSACGSDSCWCWCLAAHCSSGFSVLLTLM